MHAARNDRDECNARSGRRQVHAAPDPHFGTVARRQNPVDALERMGADSTEPTTAPASMSAASNADGARVQREM